MKMKRFFAIFAIIAVLCTFCTVTAMAEEAPDPSPAGTSYATHYEAGQTYNGGKILKVENATCTEAGTIMYTDASGNTAVATIPAPGHDYKEVVTKAAGCETAGTYEKVCKVCGETEDDFKIAPTGHNYSEYETITNTCAEHTAYKVCPNCSEDECGEEHYELQEKKGPDGKVMIGQDGKPVMERKVYTLPIEKDHEFDEDKSVIVEKTCTTDGSTTLLCKHCSATKVIDTVPAAHTYGDPVSEVIDCTQVKVTYECTNPKCDPKTEGHTKTVILEVDAHQWVVKTSKAATCTEAGEVVYECSVCHATKTETPKAIGHKWGPWECTIVHSGEGDTATGWWVRTCTNPGCDETETKFSKGKPQEEQPAAPADPPATPPAQEPDEPVADSYVIDSTAMTLTEKGVSGTGRVVPIDGDEIAEGAVVRLAYTLKDDEGNTGLFVHYAVILNNKTFELPAIDLSRTTIEAACIVVVPDLANVQTPTPETLSSIVKF